MKIVTASNSKKEGWYKTSQTSDLSRQLDEAANRILKMQEKHLGIQLKDLQEIYDKADQINSILGEDAFSKLSDKILLYNRKNSESFAYLYEIAEILRKYSDLLRTGFVAVEVPE